ncbi:phage major capsid protein [Hoeflea sp. WL0058]|uniref:Phage major capsid protein n=1 Tax=Flavimaribacter sediminis TaxID=2865987 RepID=A0AAE2ZT02_9HYPH|nr:phage major capsid protein [Flavimaribacter sediminis]MBW8638987.1 phage major capsid protein [Flavimaribacter sediminis]
MSTLKEVREKLSERQDALGKVFEEAKTDAGEYDFRQVKAETLKECLGDGLKTTAQIVERVNERNAELDELAKEAEGLEAAELAAKQHSDREKSAKRPRFAGSKGNHPDIETRLKSLGEMVAGDDRYKSWAERGAANGIDFHFDEVYGSDMLAKGLAFETMGTKTLFETGAGWAPESVRLPGFVEMATRPVQLLDIFPMARTGQDTVKFMEETTRTHGAAERAEGGTFAESTFEMTERESTVRKITDSVPVTDEQLEDVAQVQSYLNGRLIFGLRQRLDSQCLIGNGTAPNLRGLKNVVGIQTQAKGADPIPDAFFKAMTKIRVTGRAVPTHHVIHSTDWEKVRLLRTADGVYIWGNPSEAGPERMWGLPVVQCDADSAGTGYVGSFLPAWVSLYERRGVDVQVGYISTQFTEGKRTIRADMRMALVFFRPAAFASVTGL